MNVLSRLGASSRIAAVAAGFALVGAAVTAVAIPASSQAGPTAQCSGDHILKLDASYGLTGLHVFSSISPTTRTFAIPAIPAGQYNVNGVSYDGYASRASTPAQPVEIWFAEYLDAAGNVLATTGKTSDLQDGVIEASWSGSIGTISWTGASATQLRVVHGAIGDPNTNSVEPNCIGATLVPTPTVAPTTTVAPGPGPSTAPTTTVPTDVLPAIVTAPPAQPQVETPQFAG